MNIMCITGWQQKADALANIAPDELQVDYSAYESTKTLFADLPPVVDVAIGWSLGGQILVRAIASGAVKAKKVVLLSTAYQFISDEYFSGGISVTDFNKAKKEYAEDPAKMLAEFQLLIAAGDKRQTEIARQLSETTTLWPKGQQWLNELSRSTCGNLDLKNFPETSIIHGKNDKIISFVNAEKLSEQLPKSRLFCLADSGHAPHLHAPDFVINIINSYV